MSRLECFLLWALFTSSLLIEVRLPMSGFSAANLGVPLFAFVLAWLRRAALANALQRHRRLLAAALAVYVWTWISAAIGLDPTFSIRYVVKYTAHLVVFACFLVFLDHRTTTESAQRTAYYFLAVLGALGVVEHWLPQSSFFTFFRNQPAVHPRVASLMIWPNQFAVLMGIGVGLGATLAHRRRIAAGGFYATVPAFLLALALSGSRSGWLVLSVLLPMLTVARVLTVGRSAAIAAAFALALITFAVPTAQLGLTGIGGLPLERLLKPTVTSNTAPGHAADTVRAPKGTSPPRATLVPRLALWRAAIDEIRRHPISGIGLEVFAVQIGPTITGHGWINTHNLFLNVATELGLVGFALFVGFLWALLRAGDPWCWRTALPLLGIGVGQIFDCFTYDHAFMTLAVFFAASYASLPRAPD